MGEHKVRPYIYVYPDSDFEIMAFEKLSQDEQKVVLQAMKLILMEKRYIIDGSFQVRMSITRDELRQVISQWPNLQDENDEDSKSNPDLNRTMAINNSLNEVLNGVSVSKSDWEKWIGTPEEEGRRIFRLWTVYKGYNRTG